MGSIVGIVVVVIGILASVALHEVGHMLPAKKFGVLVPDYAVGFGPALWKKKIGDTTYALRAILLGGYVKIVGMYAPARPGTRLLGRGGKPTLAQEAREASAEEIPEGQEHRAFYRLSAPKKIAVMLGGPLMNLLICIVLSAVTMIGIGAPAASRTIAAVPATIQAVSGEVASPAYEAGVQPGDTVVAWNGQPVATFAELQRAVGATPEGESAVLTVERDGATVDLTVTPVTGSQARIVGVTAGYEYVSASLSDVAAANWQMFTGTTAVVTRLPQAVWQVGRSVFTDEKRDASGVVSVVGVGRLAGEVTGDSQALGLRDTRQVVAVLLSLLASLNMALFVFNLIPLPPLDGGHILGAIYEGVRRTVARVRGAEDPGPADTARLVPVTWVVGGLLVAMSVILIVADIVKPVSLG
ncbi:MAG: site-2 protease family protein [Actinomyces sp.]|nr:site-2 protease family protein [Actinomyces sp.]